MDSNVVSASEVAALTQRVTGMESSIAALSSQISSLTNAVHDRSKTPWAIIISGAGTSLLAISLVGGLIAWGQSVQNASLNAKISDFQQIYADNRLVSRQDNDSKFARVDAALSRTVPREEHLQMWAGQTRTDQDQQRQIDQVRADLSQVYTPAKAFDDFQSRLRQIEEILLSFKTRGATQ